MVLTLVQTDRSHRSRRTESVSTENDSNVCKLEG